MGMLIYLALLFLSAGKWDWPWGWAFLILMILAMAAHLVVLVPINPALLADRAGGMRQPGAKRWDIWLTSLAGVFFFTIVVVAGLDVRWGWSGAIPLGGHLLGVLLFIAAGLAVRARLGPHQADIHPPAALAQPGPDG